MEKRIDKTKQSNRRCAHCGNWTGWQRGVCRLSGEAKEYYQRCKKFTWDRTRAYKN